MTIKLGILASGSGSNAQAMIDAVESGKLDAEICVIIANRPGAKVLERAAKHGIPHICIDHKTFPDRESFDLRMVAELQKAGVAPGALAGYMRVVKPKLLAAFPNRVLNIHPAILPSFPGIAGWKQSIDYGAKVAGCTVHFVNAGIDSGPIIVQRVVDVMGNDSPETLHARIQVEEHIAYPEAIRLLASHALHISGRKVIRL